MDIQRTICVNILYIYKMCLEDNHKKHSLCIHIRYSKINNISIKLEAKTQ